MAQINCQRQEEMNADNHYVEKMAGKMRNVGDNWGFDLIRDRAQALLIMDAPRHAGWSTSISDTETLFYVRICIPFLLTSVFL